MPFYQYAPTTDRHCSHCKDGFEALQKIADDALPACPKCLSPVEKVICAPHLGGKAFGNQSDTLDPKNFSKHGFTQYKRAGDGVYEKTAGKGPRFIADDGK